MRLGAVLLAAGLSRRFGEEDKLLADVQGEPMLSRAIRTLRASDADVFFAVVSTERTAEIAREKGLLAVCNKAPQEGLSRSIALGVQAARARGCDAVLLAAADQPRLTEASMRALVGAFREGTRTIACLADETHSGNPAIFASIYFEELLALRGDRGAKAVLRAHEDALRVVCCALPGELADADDPQALRALLQEP
ncbi:MAG: nucleotidyltransferase family protein [Clostridiales bacterium]|nr:nucleotidyltransferase family protein [Clostridiales bacterium]